LSTIQFLTAQERVEWFENLLQGLLEQQAIDGEATSDWCEKIAAGLMNAWSASNARIWVADTDGWHAHGVRASEMALEQSSHDATIYRLLALARERDGILWIEPSASNSLWRAIGRVGTGGNVVIELAYDSLLEPLPLPREAILLGLEHNTNLLSRFGESFWVPSGRLAQVSRYVDSIAFEGMLQRRLMCDRISEQLRSLEGLKFPTLEENQKLVAAIHRLLDENGLRLQCPNCGEPAILRCLKAGNSPAGSFLFDHRVNGRRTMHGGKGDLPSMHVVDRAPRVPIRSAQYKVIRVANDQHQISTHDPIS
jgi:hypothetical protein